VFTSGLQSKATVSATAVERTLAGQTLLLRCDGVMMPVSLDVPVTSTARNAVLVCCDCDTVPSACRKDRQGN
jgi:hypothetical protein